MEIVKTQNLEKLNQNIKDDFFKVPNLKFDVDKLKADLNIVLKKKKFNTLGIKNFGAISINQIPGDKNSTEGHNVRGTYWTCLLYTSPSPRDTRSSRMPSSA